MNPAVIVTLPLALVFTLMLIGYVNDQRTYAQVAVCGDKQMQEHIRGITIDALDVALSQHVTNLYVVWMRDEKDQPRRAQAGMSQGISAYVRARKEADAWSLKSC